MDTTTVAPKAELDLATLTLGEMAAAELASGQSFEKLLTGGRATRWILALYVQRLRSSESTPLWSEVADLRPFGG